jgi:hypothetical protein
MNQCVSINGLVPDAWRVRMPYWNGPGIWNEMPKSDYQRTEYEFWSNREGAIIEYAVLTNDLQLSRLLLVLDRVEIALANRNIGHVERIDALDDLRAFQVEFKTQRFIEKEQLNNGKAESPNALGTYASPILKDA